MATSERTRALQTSMSTGALPVGLPGMKMTAGGGTAHHKAQRWTLKRDTRIELDFPLKHGGALADKKQQLLEQWHALQEAEKLHAQQAATTTPKASSLPSASPASKLRVPPKWLKHSREVLRFFMYFQEPVYESQVESFRVRKCVCYYYLENGSIAVDEPKESNSGLSQGSFLKRGVVQRDGAPGVPLAPEDFLPGCEVTIHGRTFRCIDVDQNTRDWFEGKGVELGAAEAYPEDDHRRKNRESAAAELAKVNRASKNQRQQQQQQQQQQQLLLLQQKEGCFLGNDQTLKFRALWDDTGRLYGEKNFYTLCFFLSDETLEVRRRDAHKSGDDSFPILLKRSKLPKAAAASGSAQLHKDGGGAAHFVTAADLVCGEFLDCWGRKLMLLSCADEFTQQYYERVHGLSQSTVTIREPPKSIIKKVIPPYNGFGSEADSLANCLNLIPKPVSQDLHRFLNNRGKTLKFKAKFVSPCAEDAERRFLITFFMDDDTVAVYEPPKRNSGIMGGKFLERGKYKKPVLEKTRRNDDLKKLQTEILDKIQSHLVGGPFALLRAFRKFGTDEHGNISFENFNTGLRSIGILDSAFTNEQLNRLFTAYDRTGDNTIDYQEFVDHVMQDKPIATNETRFSSRWLRGSDFFVGATLQLLFPQTGAMTQEFVILSADKQTLDMMADNPSEFPKSNVEAIAAMLAETLDENHVNVTDAFRVVDREGKGWIHPEEFGQLLRAWALDFGLVAEELTDHEMLTLVRHYDRDSDGRIYYNEFAAALKKQKVTTKATGAAKKGAEFSVEEATALIFEKLQNLSKGTDLLAKFSEIDEDGTGKISWEEFQLMLRRFDIFLNNDRDKSYLMLRFDQNGDGLIDYQEFFNSLFDSELVKEAGQLKKRLIPRDPKSLLEHDSAAQYEADARNMLEYQSLLQVQQAKKSEQVLLKSMFTSFVAKFNGREKMLMRIFASYDTEATGKVTSKEFHEALRKANPDYSKVDRWTLMRYVFKDPAYELDYRQFLDIVSSQDYHVAISTYGHMQLDNQQSDE
jgi:Ca2+-binding EF-hand superfamily protein